MRARAPYGLITAAAAATLAVVAAAGGAAAGAMRLVCAFEVPCPDAACAPGPARGELALGDGVLWISGLRNTWGARDLTDARRQGFYSETVSEREGTRIVRVESPHARGLLFAWSDGRAALSLSVPGTSAPRFENFGGRCEVTP